MSLAYVSQITSSTAIDLGFDSFLVDATGGDITISLPDASTNDGLQCTIFRTDSANTNVNLVGATGTQNINGNPNFSLINLEHTKLVSFLSNWYTLTTGKRNPLQIAFIYHLNADVLNNNDPVSFSNNGVISSAFSHTNGSSSVTINQFGVYEILFNCSSSNSISFGIGVNGVVDLSTITGNTVGGSLLSGQAILQLNTNDVITLVNVSNSTITLLNNANGVNIVSASLILKRHE